MFAVPRMICSWFLYVRCIIELIMKTFACLSYREKYSLEQDIREKEDSIRQKTNEVQVKPPLLTITDFCSLK